MNASGFSSKVANLDLSAASDTQLTQLEDAFRSIADSIAIARRVVKELKSDFVIDADEPDAEGGTAFDQDRRDVERAISTFVPGGNAQDVEAAFRKRILEHFEMDGWTAAGVLSCLIRLPGRLVTHADLAKGAGVQSGKSDVVRVYICQIRASLIAKGYQVNAIETGRGTYRIVRSVAFEIVNALARG